MKTDAKVRADKEAHPERYCIDPQCLWRTVTREGPKPCPKHPVSERKTASFGVASPAILMEAINQFYAGGMGMDTVPGMVMGLDMIRKGLGAIAKRAIELNDSRLLELMDHLGCIHPVREKSPTVLPGLVEPFSAIKK